MTEAAEHFLDTTGLRCPEPIMLLHGKLRQMKVGERVLVVATDPSTQRDIAKLCHFLNHELLSQRQEADTYRYIIKKASV
ncbi:MAG: tRNA 2-thiouridine synthesizing protein A [Cellvibrionaceae bacterium]|jgi:tRNA 2-thiouridine synthesizing protein A